MSDGPCIYVITARDPTTTTVRMKLFATRVELNAWYQTHWPKPSESVHVVSLSEELMLTFSVDDAKERILEKLRDAKKALDGLKL